MYKAAICDDSPQERRFVSDLLKSWAGERQIPIRAECFPSAEAFLFRYAEDQSFDLLLLDIEMGQTDGVTMARQIRAGNDTVQIVFITGYSEYIAEGYEVAALHYLLKPVNREKFFSVLDRAVERLRLNERCLTLTLPDGTVRIPLHEIRRLEVRRNYVTVHAKQDYAVKRTLSELEGLLDDRFHRVGRSMIVNLNMIRKVTRTEVHLADGTVLPLPRGAYEALNRAIIALG